MSMVLPWCEFKPYVAETGPGRGRPARATRYVFCEVLRAPAGLVQRLAPGAGHAHCRRPAPSSRRTQRVEPATESVSAHKESTPVVALELATAAAMNLPGRPDMVQEES
jgi:hypothetical protein